jgi:hypothetical protein
MLALRHLANDGAQELSRAAKRIRASVRIDYVVEHCPRARLASHRDHFARSVLPSRRP